ELKIEKNVLFSMINTIHVVRHIPNTHHDYLCDLKNMRIFIFFFLVVTSQWSWAQRNIVDSLLSIEKGRSQKDTIQVALLNEISFRIFKNQPATSVEYARKALAL